MARSYRSSLPLVIGLAGAWALVAWPSEGVAQAYDCRPTETQPECHRRLECDVGEDLQDCQDRLRQESRASGSADRSDRARGDDARGDRASRGDARRDSDARSDSRRDRDSRDSSRRGRDRGDRSRADRSQRRGGDRDGRSRSGGSGSSAFVANKTFGLGLEIGAPYGLTGKYFLSDSGALDFGVGGIYHHYYFDRGFHVYLDYLWHPVSLASTDSFELPLYIGLGGRFWDFEHCRRPDRRDCRRGSALGLRAPIGLAFDFNRTPLDIFFQVVPVLDFLGDRYRGHYDRRAHLGLDGSVGFRYWFH